MKKILISLVLIFCLLMPFTANSQQEIQQPAMTIQVLGSFTAPQTGTLTLTNTQAMNIVVYYGATGTINLPVGITGMNVLIYNTGAFTITIDPNGSQVIVRGGTAQTGGVSITLSSGAGNLVTLVFDGGSWTTMGVIGTLAQGS